jgi:hypothetical protein
MQSKASTVKQYMDELPAERRRELAKVRAVVRKSLAKGYREGMLYGGIGYYIPHSLYPAGYHCDPKIPLPFAGMAAQKNYLTLSLMCVYNDKKYRAWFLKEWKKTGKKMDMGKSCIRFKRAEDLPLELIGEAVARVPVSEFVAHYEAHLPASKR